VPDIGQRQLGEDERLKALIVTAQTDVHHDWRTMTPMLRDLLKETGRFDVRITEELFARGCEWAATGRVTLGLPEGFGEPVPGGDWWPTTLEPMVRGMFEQRRAAAAPTTEPATERL
jgi:hypothetical protein